MNNKAFINEDFLLHNHAARTLYHCYAKEMPIIDYHCHLSPMEVATDKRWDNLAEIWLGGDHYKWRVMRSNGVDERFVTGDASPREKFDAFAESFPRFVRNPIFDWSQLELARFFDIYELLSPKTADEIWEITKDRLCDEGFSARGCMKRSNVEVVCTTDDPTDSLEYHEKVREDDFGVKMFPAWRPDKAFALDRPEFWNRWIDQLEAATNSPCCDFDDMLNALSDRHEFFNSMGCRLSDYGMETIPDVEIPAPSVMNQIFRKVRSGKKVTQEEIDGFRLGTLVECAHLDAESDWTMQIHYGVLRNGSTRLFESYGPDAGADSIHDLPIARGLVRFLDILDRDESLPRTILYNLNPRDNYLLGTVIGSFQRGPVRGKLQLGSGWWFNDQKDGIRSHLNAISSLGLLSNFVGMLTDSRSFLSYPRHEYFRRILCNLLGSEMEKGELPMDYEMMGSLVQDVSYNNAANYFKFNG